MYAGKVGLEGRFIPMNRFIHKQEKMKVNIQLKKLEVVPSNYRRA